MLSSLIPACHLPFPLINNETFQLTTPAHWQLAKTGPVCFIRRPIEVGCGHYLFLYNVYNWRNQRIAYLYSDDERVALTLPRRGSYNVFVLITDLVSGRIQTAITGWFRV